MFRNKTNKYITIVGAMVLIYFTIIGIWPLLFTVIASFFKTNYITYKFVDIKNYQIMFSDSVFWSSIKNNLIFFVVKAGAGIFFALTIAFLIDYIKGTGRRIYTAMFFVPVITPIVATSVVWKLLYFPGYGLVDKMFYFIFGIERLALLENPKTALLAIIFMDIWKNSGLWIIILLAGINEIPESIYDSAKIDGVSPVGKYFKITMPLLKPQIFFLTAVISITSMQVFRQVYMMTEPPGGPHYSTMTMVVNMYTKAFQQFSIGYASTMILVIIIIMLILVNFQRKAFTFSDM